MKTRVKECVMRLRGSQCPCWEAQYMHPSATNDNGDPHWFSLTLEPFGTEDQAMKFLEKNKDDFND